MGSDLSVVNSARVSFGKTSKLVCTNLVLGTYDLSKGDKKLINYLAKHKHTSPFGHAFASFHIKAPIFVARQLVKHKFLRWNEISRRYVDDEPEFFVPDVWRGRSADKKQGSEGKVDLPAYAHITSSWKGYEGKGNYYSISLHVYKDLLKHGVAPEQARMVLPQSTMTEWYWSGSLDAFADMCRLRTSGDTQAETQEVAWQIYREMDKLFPVAWDALLA
jgi:thymidylate synthase (FAD)|tara:strand:- start:34 stop:690 length:657 start_codon:yes stop_codon:yes gene_type:complete